MDPSIQRFAADLLTLLGGSVMEEGKDRLGVSLPPDLAARFDFREAVDFYLSPEAFPEERGAELLIPGSYWLDKMLTLVEGRGEIASIRLAPIPSGDRRSHEPPENLVLLNGSAKVLSVRQIDRPYLLVHFKLTFLSDDIEETLFPVWVDLGSEEPKPMSEGFPWTAIAEGVDLGSNVSFDRRKAGLDAAMQMARSVAEEEARLRSEERDREIEQRLQNEFVRLDQFYSELLKGLNKTERRLKGSGAEELAEVRTEKRRLKEEKQRRKQEAYDKFQLKVVVRPINAAWVLAPEAIQELQVSDGGSASTVTVHLDLVRGTAGAPHCSACREPTTELHLCRRGHLTCGSCAKVCFHCQRTFCTPCGILPCPRCGQQTCPDCSTRCAACGESMCKSHLQVSEDTGEMTCLECAVDCPLCHRRYRTTPFRRCAVDGEKVCPSCRGRCPVCRRQFCSNHLPACAACGRNVCSDDRNACPHCLQHFCMECLPPEARCPTCLSLFPVRQSEEAIVGVLEAMGIPAGRLGSFELAEDREHFVVTGKGWWWSHLFVLEKTTLGVVAQRRWCRWWGRGI